MEKKKYMIKDLNASRDSQTKQHTTELKCFPFI